MSQARNLANLGVHTTTSAGAVTFLDGATDVDVAQHDGSNGLKLGGTLVSSSATELNLLDGVSGLVQADLTKLAAIDSSAAEVNLIDGSSAGTIVNSKAVVYGGSGQVNGTTLQIAGSSITSSAAELNLLDGVSGLVQADFTKLAAITTSATDLNNSATTGKAIAMAIVFG